MKFHHARGARSLASLIAAEEAEPILEAAAIERHG